MPLTIGDGWAVTDHADGALLQVVDPRSPARRFLTDGAGPDRGEHRWGSGFVITDQGSGRWRTPHRLAVDHDHVHAEFQPTPSVRLDVDRLGGSALLERYAWTNTSARVIIITSLAVNTPFHDVYPDAATALREAVHAHVWTGGADAWVLAEPMSGQGRLLGLVVRTGALWAYSVEGRNQNSSSNVRGHLLLHPTDRARNPAAFGGQPEIVLEPGESWVLEWHLGLYTDRSAFLADTRPGLQLDRLVAEVGESITLTGSTHPTTDGDALVEPAPEENARVAVTGTRHGVVHVGDHARRTAVLFTDPLPALVRRRVRFVLAHQRAVERLAPDDAAFVPYDVVTGLTQTANGWPDWSDGAERLAMPTLLQQALRRGWVDDPAEVADALDRYAVFARTGLLDETAAPRWGTTVETPVRIYNSPWLAHFFADEHIRTGDQAQLDLAARILERSVELGAVEHLSIGHAEAMVAVADLLDATGEAVRAAALRTGLLDQAEHFRAVGADLPQHEVSYEQSMVAPLVTVLALAERLERQGRFVEAMRTAVRWLRAFGGPQPHVRLHQIGIRHWDGYWFGRDRQWGDTFPHHWSVLTAVALSQLPASVRTPESDAAAEQIFRANLAHFYPDGSATCAFVLPSAVDGRPGYHADPLANDQDWPLTLWLRVLGSDDHEPNR